MELALFLVIISVIRLTKKELSAITNLWNTLVIKS